MAHQQKKDTPARAATAANANPNSMSSIPALDASNAPLEPAIRRAMPHAAAGHYEKALGILAAGGSIPEVQNARGVCLLRLGRYEDAVRMYRGLVLQAGGTWSKADVPMLYKTNFATALLLNGHPSGCLSILEEIADPMFPPVVRLRQALAKWHSTLTFMQRINWWFGRLEPPHCKVVIDFPPGDFAEIQATADEGNVGLLNVYPPGS